MFCWFSQVRPSDRQELIAMVHLIEDGSAITAARATIEELRNENRDGDREGDSE
jgi:hypothetical protein